MQRLELMTREDFIPVKEQLKDLAKKYECLIQKSHWKVYTNDELAKLLKVSKRTLQNWRDEGQIEFVQVKSKIYYTLEDVQRFINNNKNKSFKKNE